MELKVRYENKYQTIVIGGEDEKNLWVSLSIEEDYNETPEKERQNRIQDEFEKKLNRRDYNNWHKETRHIWDIRPCCNEEDEQNLEDEALMKLAKNKGIFTKDLDRFEEEQENEYLRKKLRRFLSAKEVDVIIAKDVDGVPLIDYAEMINESKDAVTKRHKRAKDKLKNIPKDVLFS